MIIIFWVINAIMLLLALAFVLVPIIRNHHKNGPGIRKELNIHIHKEHLQELKNDFKEGNIDEKEFSDAKHELERNLLTDIAGPEKGDDHVVTSISLKTIVPIIVVLPVFVIVSYLMLGDIDMVSIQVDKKEQQANQEKMHSIEEMVAKLRARLQEQPDNGEGWRLLARTYLMMNRYQDAIHAYQNARKYIGDDPELLADYSEALISANNNSFSEEAADLITLSLQTNPDEPKALWIAGYASFEQGDIAKTLHYWERLFNVLSPGSDESESLLENINRIKQNVAAISHDKGIAVTEVTDSSMTTIDIQVSLASALLEKAGPEDTVFIFARASEGSRMPLAIVRKQVKDLPVNVTLDDSTAMSPAMKLSKFKQVVISARVSKSGDATPRSGDLSGSSAAIQPGEVTGVNITIDQILP